MPNSTKQKSASSKRLLLLFSLLIFVIFFAALNQNPWTGTSLRNTPGTINYEEKSWTLQQEDGTVLDTQLTLPTFMALESGQYYTLSTTLTYNGANDQQPYGFLHLDHAYCRVLLDGQVLFSYMPDDIQKWDASKSSGFIYKAFPLPHDCMGKTLTIQLLPPLSTPLKYGLPEIQFGDYSSMLQAAVYNDAPHDVIVVLCVLLGVFTILFSTTNLRRSELREGISIGIFSLLFALYLITECRLNVYYIGNPYYLYLLNYITFSLLPISLMAFMRERLQEKHQKICTFVIIGELIFFALEMGLHFGGIFDLREMIPVIHCLYFIDIVLITHFILTMKDKKRKQSLVLQIAPVIYGMIVDALIYWLHLHIGGNDATFTILGVIVFLFIELVRVWKSSMSIYSESVRSKLYRQMAYVDELTQIGNRRAYEEEMATIIADTDYDQSMIIVSVDVNDLKHVNDYYGHPAGDHLIRSAAQIMQEVVGDKGKVFRIGGDEFTIFLYDTNFTEYDQLVKRAQKEVDTFNLNNPFLMSLAVGHVQLQNNHILEAVKSADKQMYENKALYKKQKQRCAASL